MATDRDERPEFDGRNEKDRLREEAQIERQEAENEFSENENEQSPGNSIRNFGEVSGTTFGAESNPAKFSNIGQQDNKAGTENPISADDAEAKAAIAG